MPNTHTNLKIRSHRIRKLTGNIYDDNVKDISVEDRIDDLIFEGLNEVLDELDNSARVN